METSRLEEALEGDLEKAEKIFKEYDERMERLGEIWSNLYNIDFTGFEDEYQQIYESLRDPFAVEELEKRIAELEEAVTKRREEERKKEEMDRKKREEDLKRYNIQQVIMGWRSQGYDTSELEALLEEDLDKAREAVAKFEADVKHLWEIGRQLNTLDVRGFEDEYYEIRNMLYDTTKVGEARNRLNELMKKTSERAKEKGEDFQSQRAQRKEWEARRKGEERERFQEEARKAAEEKQKAKEEWERKLAEEKQAVAKARMFLSELAAGMTEAQPELSPLGLYLGDRKWVVEKDLDKMEVRGKVSTGIFSDHLFVVCRWVSAAQVPTIPDLVNYYKTAAIEHGNKGQFLVLCLVMNRLSDASIEAVEKFDHRNCAALLYDISDGSVHYNEGSLGADIYSGYFRDECRPKPLKEILEPIGDKYEVWYRKDVGPRFEMDEKEVDRMIKHLRETNRIFPVEERKGSFSFA